MVHLDIQKQCYFNSSKANLARITNLAIKFDDMKYINVFSSFFLLLSGICFKYQFKIQEETLDRFVLATTFGRLVKIDVDASRKITTRSTSISYVMRDNHATIVKAKGKRIASSPILVAECLVLRKAIALAMLENVQKV